ncbi:MAG: hypothetical protein KJ017_03905 [Alphaproteobacteria bacterium]|nr:hypothetical protein [Alphaproteobacteria bacterium]
MVASDPSGTIRAIFRTLPGGTLRLRKPPTAKIDPKVLRVVFSPAQSLKGIVPETAAPSRPAAKRGTLRTVRHPPHKK